MTSRRSHQTVGPESNAQGANRRRREWAFLVIWEFRVREGMEACFEHTYGAKGDWVRLFQHDPSHIKTEFVCDSNASRTYVTLDFWSSEKAYDAFRKRNLAEYKALDEKCAGLTESERQIGRFVRVSRE